MDHTIAYLVALFLGLGAVTAAVTGALKRLSSWVDNLPALSKALFAYVVGLLVTWLGSHLGIQVPNDVHTWNIPLISAVLTAFISYGWHSLFKSTVGTTTPPTTNRSAYQGSGY